MMTKQARYTIAEELFHAISHGAGALLSIAGLAWMLAISIVSGDPWRISASVVYGISLIGLFLASTIYHALPTSPRSHVYKLFDHCAIYLLIAGTYTPFLLVSMRNTTGWWLFAAVWSLASAGILTKLWFRQRFHRLALVSYLLMGWLIVIAAPQIAHALGPAGMSWLVAGGVSYTVGALFYGMKRMPYHHAVWHVFVLLGGICHFLAVVLYVLPTTFTGIDAAT